MKQIRIDIKIFAASNEAPPTDALIGVFHRWIQTSRLDELILDVADYTHVHQGPGVLLLCHGSHYSLDAGGGELGLLYSLRRDSRRAMEPQDARSYLAGRLTQVFRASLEACQALEEEEGLAGRLQFPGDRFHLLINDRWAASQEASEKSALGNLLESEALALLRQLFPSCRVTLEPLEGSRLGFEIRADRAPGAAALLERLPPKPMQQPVLAEAVGI